jgi:hypothetical protein
MQATGGRPRNSCCQTVAQSLLEEQAEELMSTPSFAAFLEAVRPRWVGGWVGGARVHGYNLLA